MGRPSDEMRAITDAARARRACDAHLRDLQRAHTAPPASISALRSAVDATRERIAAPEATSGASSAFAWF